MNVNPQLVWTKAVLEDSGVKTLHCYRRTPKELIPWRSQKKNLCLNDCQMSHESIRFCFVLEAEANSGQGYIQALCEHGGVVGVCNGGWRRDRGLRTKWDWFQSVLCLPAVPITRASTPCKWGLNPSFSYSHGGACLCVWACEWPIEGGNWKTHDGLKICLHSNEFKQLWEETLLPIWSLLGKAGLQFIFIVCLQNQMHHF